MTKRPTKIVFMMVRFSQESLEVNTKLFSRALFYRLSIQDVKNMSVYFSTFSHSTLKCTFVNFAEKGGKESFLERKHHVKKRDFVKTTSGFYCL